jgi:hypothetical protein
MNRQKKIYQKLKRKAQRVKKRQSTKPKERYIPKAEREAANTSNSEDVQESPSANDIQGEP